MINVSILKQLEILLNILKNNSYLMFLSVIAILSFLILLLANKFKNKKITKILCISVYLIIFFLLFSFYHKEMFELFDYLVNNIFLFMFFPNLAVYVLVLIISNVIIIKSTFFSNYNKICRSINILFFVIFNIIFYLIIDNVIKNEINVYEQLSIYTNNDLLILIQLNMKLFLIWLIVLLIIKISFSIINKIKVKVIVDNFDLVVEEEINNQDEVDEIYPTNIVLNNDIESNYNKYNVYNDYIDLEPVKKHLIKIEEIKEISDKYEKINNNLEEKINNNLEEKAVINIDSNINEVNENITYNGKSFSMFEVIDFNENKSILSSDIDYSSNLDVDKEFNCNDKNGFINQIVVENNDSSFEKYSDLEFEDNDIDYNMNLLFNEDNDYIKNIVFDINELKNNANDKNQIQKIYNEIKLNQKDLTLNDYNYLINMLLDIRNSENI